ncbi:MAG: Sua5/YciO/YrdC/YwlC family protein, partial [Anaerolineaceae bacterium]
LLRRLITLVGPMAVTSANLSGQANTASAQAVLEQLDGRIDLLLDGGPTAGDIPSTVVDCTGEKPRVLRWGVINRQKLEEALGGLAELPDQQ